MLKILDIKMSKHYFIYICNKKNIKMNDMTVGKEGKLILVFAVPMLMGNVFQQLYNVVDSIIVGNYLGKEALAAVGASFPVIFVLISVIIGVASGFSVVISQYYGAKQFENVRRTIDTMFIFLFIASIFITIIGLAFSRLIFIWLKLPEEIIPEATLYFQIYISGILLFFGFNGTSAALRGLGDSKTPLYFLVIATLLNIVLDLVFVLVLNYGVEGVAFATVLSQGVSFLLITLYLNKFHPLLKFSISNFKWDKEIFAKSLRIGIPTGFQQSFVALGMIALIRIVNDFGTDTIAAYTVAGRLDSFIALPAMNFSMALSTFVGQNMGANRPDRVRAGYIATLKLSAVISIIISLVMIFFSRSLMGIFTSDIAVIEVGQSYLHIVSGFYIFFTAMFINHGILRGAGDTLVPMFITLFSLWVLRIPISLLLSREFIGIGSDGIWWGIPIAWVVGFLLSYIYYKTGRWKKKVIVPKIIIKEDL